MTEEEIQVYLDELEKQKSDLDSTTPLQKPKKIKEGEQDIEKVPVVKKKRPKPPKTELQLKSFKEKVVDKRLEMCKRKDLEKKIEAGKAYLESLRNAKRELPKIKEENVPVETKVKKPIVEKEESEEEIIYVKKPKKKKTIVIESSSESESEIEIVEKKKEFGKSHRNKKSVVKIESQPKPQPISSVQQPKNYHSYFCD